ncbi:MAG: ABC transporter ATP-binding protein [Candidatus Wallbacteria bacterium]
MIKVSDLTKKYGDFTAVDSISFEIKKGEIFGFLGPNGAGKTTTIKMLTGLLKPTSGDISIDGINILESDRNFEKVKSVMGYIPDTPNVYDKLTGMEFLKFIASIFKVDWKEAEPLALNYLERFNIIKSAGNMIETYSHGMRQKLVFTSALIHNPAILIVDEPMIGLDPKNVRVVKDIFREISQKGGTIFLSTHTLSVAEELCSRVAIIFHGRIKALDTVENLKKKVIFDTANNQSDSNDVNFSGKTLEEIFLMLTDEENENNEPASENEK